MNHGAEREGSVAREVRAVSPALLLSVPLIGALSFLTGGRSSPWLGLLYLPVALSAMVSIPVAALVSAWAAAGWIVVVLANRGSSPVATGELALHVLVFLAIGLGLSALFEQRRVTRRRVQSRDSAGRTAHDVGQMMTAAYDLAMTLDLVTLKQRDVLAADSYAVFLVDGASLRVGASSGLGPDVRLCRLSVHDEDHGWRPTDGRPLVIADTSFTATAFADIDPRARSILVTPLYGIERLVGLLYYGSSMPNAFPAEAIDRAEAFANTVVFPVQRALLEEDLRRLAFTDAQTSLYNHRHFQSQLDEEVSRAQRYGRVVSLIMVDIDNFKQFNDAYGHPTGDRLLSELAHTVRSNLRTVDIAARYGGEEFAVICPETQRDQAVILAERLCATISATDYVGDIGTPRHITVSVGVASYPADARSKSELIEAADKALYESKRAGKNRVTACGAVVAEADAP